MRVALGLSLLSVACTSHRSVDCGESADPPEPGESAGNVLVVVLDDVGTDQLAPWGVSDQVAQTPAIDCLCERGLRFTQAWASPMCSPSRAELMTGRYNRRTGIGQILSGSQPSYELAESEDTLAEVARRADYATGLAGKWHLASTDLPEAATHPNRSGFDHFAGSLANFANTAAHGGDYSEWEKVENGRYGWTTTYPTTDSVDEALAFVGETSEPWLLVISFNAPHKPMHVPPRKLVRQKLGKEPTEQEQYRAMLEAVDVELNRFFTELDPQVLAETTVLLFGDNGSPDHAIVPPLDPDRSKGTMFEAGVRIPLVIAGPHVAEPGVSDALVHIVDILPTVADLLGETSRADELDGRSLVPLLDGTAPSVRETVASFLYSPVGSLEPTTQKAAIRDEDYKLVVHDGVDESLYRVGPDSLDEGEDLLAGPLSEADQAALGRLQAALRDLEASF